MSDLMPEYRHQQLVKAAEAVIELMNIGVDGNAALAKHADDAGMNDKEVDLVVHAVNNSRQLAHLQEATPEDREKPFPLLDGAGVQSYRQQPATNAQISTSEYAKPADNADNAKSMIEAPDAVETKKRIEKEARASYADAGDYRERPVAEKVDLAAAWGIQAVPDRPTYESPTPFAKISQIQIGVEYGRELAEKAKLACERALDRLSFELRRVDCPEFAQIEKVARALGAGDETMDMVYAAAGLEKFGAARCPDAGTGRVYTDRRTRELADLCVEIDQQWKFAASATAAASEMQDEYRSAEAKIAGFFNFSADISPKGIAEPLSKIPEEFIGTNPEMMQTIIGEKGSAPDTLTPRHSVSQSLANVGTARRLQELMSDEFISGHELPEIVEAFNAALSVNPNFGNAEIRSYVRQHLASRGAVPLDLQIRARQGKGV